MDVLLRGKPSSMIVFICSRCKSPLMRYEGEIFELDREEFNSLRKKLSRVLDALVEESSDIKREGLAEIPLWNSDDSITSEAVDEMLKLLEESKDVDDFINQI
ncbi:MAG TPA: hypothetical protein PK366_06855 [Fibrobacteraceae bacterium]|nr:hypothetical protein [Fibrobacteraceae bacterium]HQB65366.1 hypothetical protein [Fibrobacteraceae bacterium]